MYSPSPSPSRDTKRKRDDESSPETSVVKPAKPKKKQKAKQVGNDGLDLASGINLAIGKLDSRLLADYVAQRTKRFSPNLSLVELEDLHIPGNNSVALSDHVCLQIR